MKFLYIFVEFGAKFVWFYCKELDIAIVKATNHVERPPKERYVRSECIFMILGSIFST